MPKDLTFFDHFEHLSACLVEETKALTAFVAMLPEMDGYVAKMEKTRHEAHRITRECLLRLDTAFITPFDREDILQLVTELYQAIAAVATSGRRVELYRLADLHPSLKANVGTLSSMSLQVDVTVKRLSKGTKLTDLRVNLDEIGRLEESGRNHRDRFLLEIFQGNPDPFDVMKKREVHDLIVDGIRLCDNLGRTVERILLKND